MDDRNENGNGLTAATQLRNAQREGHFVQKEVNISGPKWSEGSKVCDTIAASYV